MERGPVEVLVLAFPGNQFSGDILPELRRLVESGIISIVDAVFTIRDADGELAILELVELQDDEGGAVRDLVGEVEDLLSDDDIEELASALEPESSAAILVFEHRWAAALRTAVVGAGGLLAANFRVPAEVVARVRAQVETGPASAIDDPA